MANSGNFTTNEVEGRSLRFSWNAKSQSIANNQTTINWTLKGAGSYTYGYVTCGNFKVVINGSTVYSSSTRVDVYSGDTVASGTATITHTADGTKTFSASAQAGIYYVAVSATGSGSWTLPAIARMATITSSPESFSDVDDPTIQYSNAAADNVTTLQAAIGSTDGNTIYVPYRDISKTGTSYTFELTENERNTLRQACSANNYMDVKFYIKTVISGSTLYSSATTLFTLTDVFPTFNAAYQDTNSTTTAITNNNQQIIRNHSTLQVNITNAVAKKYATLVNASVTINGNTYSTTTFNSGAATINVGTLNIANNITAEVRVTDSRGNVSKINLNLIILDWVLPTAIISCERKNNFYSETDVKAEVSYSSLDSKNTISCEIQYKKITDSTWTTASLTPNIVNTYTLDNKFMWNVKVIVSDLLGSTTYNMILNKGIPLAFFDSHLMSVGFNKFPEHSNSLAADGDMYLGGRISNRNILDKKSLVPGDVTDASATIRLSTRQMLYLEAGSYVFSTNLESPYEWSLILTTSAPPFVSWPTGNDLILDTTWQTVKTYSLTVTTPGYLIMSVRKSDNSTLTVADALEYEYQLEKNTVPTEIVPFDILDISRVANAGGVELYEKISGSNDTITLNDDLSNYKFIEIYVKDNNGVGNNATKVFMPNGKNVGISLTEASSATKTYIRRTRYNLSGTQITPNTTTAGYVLIDGSSISTSTGTNYLYITKVLGWR